MNDDDKNLKVSYDAKNCTVPVSPKKAIQRSAQFRHNPCPSNVAECLQFDNRTHGKTDPHVSREMTKRLSYIPTKKVPQIHESGRKVHADKHCAEQPENAVFKTVRNPRSRTKHEKKYSKALVSDEKLSASVSRKQQSALKTKPDTVINDSNGNISKKTPCKTSRKKSLPKITEVSGKTILSSTERATRREYREKNCYGKKEVSSRMTSKQPEKVDRRQESHRGKKYSDRINVKEKIKLHSTEANNNADNLEKIKETKEIHSQKIAETKKTLCKETVHNSNDINSNIQDNGAARTRIFKRKKSSEFNKNLTNRKDGIFERENECFKNEAGNKNPLPTEKRNRDDQENKTSDSTEHNCEQDSIDSSCNNNKDKIISLYNGDLATPESSTNCNRYQEFGETYIKMVGETASDNFSFITSSKTSTKQMLPGNTQTDSIKENASSFSEDTEVCRNESVSRKDEKELSTESNKELAHDYERIEKSLTVSKIPTAVAQDEVRHYTNLINYGYDSDQQYCKRPNIQYQNHMSDKAIKLINSDKNEVTLNDDAKYDLMKALIQPVAKIHDSKHTDNISKLLISARRSECVLTNKNEGLQDCYINTWSQGNIRKETPCQSSSIKQSQDITNNLESFETLNPYTSGIYLNEQLNNTSDCIGMNLKIKGCKPTKKYRHFKHEDKNMCCNMARYIKRMVSNERKYQEFENKGHLEREEVKIIIDENSPKTSKIRIVNDRSSVSVVCHSLGRTSSPSERKNNALANKAESSEGESSGYKSFHNNSNLRNVDLSDQIEGQSKDQHEMKHSAIITSHNPRQIQVQHYNPSAYSTYYKSIAEPVCDKPNISNSVNSCNPLHINNPVNRHGVKVEKDLNSQQDVNAKNHEKQNTEIKYSAYDIKNYLSTFSNRMDVYLPCEIIAYQFEEKKKNKILHFNNNELVEKDVDDADLHIGRYLTDQNSDTKDQSSEGEESSEQLGSVKDLTTAEDEVIVLKEPDDMKYDSLEFVVNERMLQPDNSQTRTDSTEILAAPAQYRIVTSQMKINPEEITESSEKPINASYVKFTTKDKGSVTVVKSSIDNIQINHSYTTLSPLLQVRSNDMYEKSQMYEATSSGRYDNENEISDPLNAVHELWTNKKSTVDSTDWDSQSSGRSRCRKCDPKKNETNKFKFKLFRKLKSSASEKTITVPLNQLPKPPPSFLETSAPSQSTIYSSTANINASGSDVAKKSPEFAAPILHGNSLTKSRADTEPIHYAKRTRTDSVSNESINHSRFQINESIAHEDAKPDINLSIAPLMARNSLVKSGESRSAVPPPASALPPPYPFCCPLVPYMMQYWQNDQQPPPASTVPLPEADWKPNINMLGSEPPPPGVVPIPWFPPMMHNMNNPPQSGEMDSRKSNTLHGQPPPAWHMMPRGYAPCLPCSKTPESHLGGKDSLGHEDDEPVLEFSESKQDGRKKKVSNKLFKIFRRKNRADVDTLDEDDKKGRHRQSRMDYRSNNVQSLQNEQQHLDDHSIWESPDIAGIVSPEEIGRCFRRGFRADGLTLSGENYLCTKAPSDTTSGEEDIFNFSDHDTPLDFLLALGFSVDEATAAIRDDEVRSRFKAALTEARIWVPHIATTQGTLLYLLAMKAKPKVMRYFLQLVESIVNKRITNAVKLDAYLKILEKVEEGYVSFVTLFGKDTGKEDEEDTVIVEKQRRRIFYTIFKYAESEAKEVGQPLTTTSVDLLHSLAARYRPAIGPHLQLLACYIGEGLLTKDVQLEAALIYLSRLDSSYVRLADLEKYCGLPPSERRRAEQIAKTQS